ncbi:MAG: hypothetical protein WCT22_04985 [Patescibacteria group bacterium]|jgi:hypothetical protein
MPFKPKPPNAIGPAEAKRLRIFTGCASGLSALVSAGIVFFGEKAEIPPSAALGFGLLSIVFFILNRVLQRGGTLP